MADTGTGVSPLSLFIPGMAQTQLGLQNIERQRALAQALQGQSLQPIQGPVGSGPYGNVTAPISWAQPLAKAVQAYLGGKMQNNLSDQQMSLIQGMQDRMNPPASAPDTQSALGGDNTQTPNDMGMPSGGPGPTTQNASALSQAIQANPQGAPGGATGGMGFPTIPGMSPQQAIVNAMMFPDAYGKAVMSPYQATPEQINANYANPNDPNAARAAVMQHLVPPVPMRSTTALYDPTSKSVIGYNPASISGAAPTFQGAMPTGFQQLPGAAAAIGAAAGAQAGGAGAGGAPYHVVTAEGPQGQPITLPASQIPGIGTPVGGAPSAAGAPAPNQQWLGPQPTGAFQGNPQQIAAGIQNSQLVNGGTPADRSAALQALSNQINGANPSNTSAASVTAPGGLGVQGMSAGAEAATKANEGQLAEEAKGWREAANIAVDTNYNLQHALTAAQGFDTGKIAPTIQNAKAWLQAALPASSFSQSDMNQLTNFAEFNKFAIRLGFDQARKMGARESTQIVQMAIESNPNPQLVGPAIQSIGHGLMAQNDYAIAKAKASEAWQQSHNGTLSGFNSAWQTNSDPLAYLMPYQSPQQQAQLIQRLDPVSKQRLLTSLQTMKQQQAAQPGAQ